MNASGTRGGRTGTGAGFRALRSAFQQGDRAALEKVLGWNPAAFWEMAPLRSGGDGARLALACRASLHPPRSFERLCALVGDLGPDVPLDPYRLRALAHALAGSDAVARYFLAQPALARPLLESDTLRDAKDGATYRLEVRQAWAAAGDEADFERRMRRYRVGEWCRIAVRDLGQCASTPEILGELSDLAHALVETVTRFWLRRDRSRRGPRLETEGPGARPAGFAVLAQGKLGAGELNMSSDVDLQMLYSRSDTDPLTAQALHTRFAKVAQAIVGTLSRRDGDGYCYRVDLDLRPEGKKGPVVNSVAGAEQYYETWGQSWERLALVRGRHVGGAAWVTRSFLERIQPFVYPRTADLRALDEIRAMKERMEREARLRAPKSRGAAAIDLKRDPGCIREIELFVQILQVLHGGQQPSLQTPSLLRALERLRFAGILGLEEYRVLSRGYLFLRRLENALQAREERQVHRLPPSMEGWDTLARMLAPQSPRASGRALVRRVARTRRRVRRITRTLLGETRAPKRLSPAAHALVGSTKARLSALQKLGFYDPDEALGALGALSRGMGSPFSNRSPERNRRLAVPLLEEIGQSPDPDQALRLYAELDPQLRRHPVYYRQLENPLFRRRLVELFGTSMFLARTVMRYPDLIDWLATAHDPQLLAQPKNVSHHRAELHRRLAGQPDLELQLQGVRRLKLQEMLRIGILDLAGSLDLDAVSQQLSLLAEACLQTTFDVTRDALAARVGRRLGDRFVVLGLGRLGSAEMGYGSDLDLIFVYDDTPPGPQHHEAVLLAQRLLRNLTYPSVEGPLYNIDTRLRPSGNQGPIVSSARGFVDYHRRHAMLWERQALLRARPVAGDVPWGAQLLAELEAVRYPPRLPPDAAAEIHRVRRRMEEELAQESGGHSNVKTGRGGLTDILFVCQYLVLRHGHRHPWLRVLDTPSQLDALKTTGLLSSRRHQVLRRAYRFLRYLENRLRMVEDKPVDSVRMGGPALAVLARRMGYAPGRYAGRQLQRDYERATEAVRRVYTQVLGLN